jgi:hypothetical protein
MKWQTRNDTILERAEPFLVAAPWQIEQLERRPFDLPIPDGNLIDPTRVDSAPFFDRLMIMDGLTFGPEGMPMPRWIFYSGAEIPGAIFGFAFRAEQLPGDMRERLAADADGDALVPLSMYIAVPARPPDVWFGHNLASMGPQLPDLGLRGLGTMTKAIALKAFRCRQQLGATQWRSDALHIHAKFGPMELVTAWTPAHAFAATLTYRVRLSDEALRSALGDPTVEVARPEASFAIDTEDEAAQRELQERIEAGERFVITDRPRSEPDGAVSIPIAAV